MIVIVYNVIASVLIVWVFWQMLAHHLTPYRVIATVLIADSDGKALYASLDEEASNKDEALALFTGWFDTFDDPYLISLTTTRSQQ